jgi:hypothetical protein
MTAAAKKNKTEFTLSIREDLFSLQHPEDGSDYTASVYYVVATDKRGRRFAHDYRFKGAETFAEYDAEGDYFCGVRDTRETAIAKARWLLARIQHAMNAGAFGSPVGRQYWNEIDPVYGSEAYLAYEPEIVAQERIERGEFI